MKRFLYVVGLVVTLSGLGSCTKDNDPAPLPVVGKWSVDRARYSGFTGAYAGNNGDVDLSNPTLTGYRDDFEIKSDKTFLGTIRDNGSVGDYQGTWDYTGTSLSLKYDDGSDEMLTFDNSRTPNRLTGDVVPQRGYAINATTKDTVVVNYSVQFIYVKTN